LLKIFYLVKEKKNLSKEEALAWEKIFIIKYMVHPENIGRYNRKGKWLLRPPDNPIYR
jgi:hypothetical protein